MDGMGCRVVGMCRTYVRFYLSIVSYRTYRSLDMYVCRYAPRLSKIERKTKAISSHER